MFKYTKTIMAIWFVVILLSGCGGNSSNNTDNIIVNGAIQKGPFIIGSTVIINRLSNTGENTDSTIVTKTIDDLGNFTFVSRPSELIEISSTGYYKNEITGELSYGTLTLRAISKLTDKSDQHVYVNLLTHIISNRVLGLMKANGTSFEDAVSQAENEFLNAFGEVIPNHTENNFTALTIFGGQSSSGSSYLLAMSSVMYEYAIQESMRNATNPDAELSQLVNNLEADFSNDGIIDNSSILASLREVIPNINPQKINENISNWISGETGYSPTDINEYLDSDLDGVFNITDQDDDNDGVEDSVDPYPYVPGFFVGNQEIVTNEDESINIDVSSNNPLNTLISMEITKEPVNGLLRGNYPNLTYVPNANYSGIDEFKYVLSQSSISSDEVTVFITIFPVNDDPVISGIPPSQVVVNNEYSFTPVVLNIDNDQLSFNIESIPGWANFDQATGSLYGTPTTNDAGSYDNIVISVSDGVLSVSLDPFSINVISNPWSELSPMQTTLFAPSATTYGSKILVSGGFNNGGVSRVESYDVNADSWALMGNMPTGRWGHNSHVIDNVLYIVGGEKVSGEIASVEAYDMVSGIWLTKAPLSVSRSFHTSCVFNGKIFVFGGFTEDGDPNRTHSLFLPSVEMYDPQTDTWSQKSSMGRKNWGMSCVVFNDKIYVIGGENNESKYEIYDPISDFWQTGGILNTPRSYGFAVSIINGKIYLLGGRSGLNITNVVEELDLLDNTWSTKSTMPTASQSMGYTSVGDAIFLFGGVNGQHLNTVEAYNPLLD